MGTVDAMNTVDAVDTGMDNVDTGDAVDTVGGHSGSGCSGYNLCSG